LSPSHTAAAEHADAADLHGLDFLASLLVHALVIGTITALAMWEVRHTPEPLQRIQVSMITPAELDKMIRQAARPKPVRERPQPKQAPPRPERIIPKPSKMPTLAKPVSRPRKAEKPFDPFAPLESKEDVTTAPSRSENSTVANMQMQQLSQQEINRYIAMIQAAVERHWKVPVNLGNIKNPLVELQLQPDGSVASIRVLESSGNAALDDSLGRAIMAAAPFQLPQQQFEAFRDMKIRFIPLVNQQQ
jgi:periplasmic protein TonB